MEGIYKFYWDRGRNGFLEGIFTAYEEDVLNIIGKRVYFGEVLGKHSEIDGDIDSKDITLITKDKEAVQVFNGYSLECGYNPFDYLSE